MRKLVGFTLIELLVAIGIISMLVVFAYATVGSLQDDQLLKQSSTDIISLLRLAQSNATARLICKDASGIPHEGASWMVVFNTGAKTIDLKCSDNTSPIKTLSLPTGIQIDGIATTPLCATPNLPVTFTFMPLSGSVSFSDSTSPQPTCITGKDVTVVVKNTNLTCSTNCSNPCNESSKCIKIDSGGAIDN